MNSGSVFPARLALNSWWLLLARVGAQALMLVFTALVARRMGEAGLGQYAFVAAVVYIGNAVTTFGTDSLIIREVARTREAGSPLIPGALWIQLALSLIWLALIALIPNLSAVAHRALLLYSLALFPWAFFTLFTALLRAFERMDLYLLLNLAALLLQTGGAALVVTSRTSVVELCLLLVAVQAVAALLGGVLCAARLPGFHLSLNVPIRQLRTVLRAAVPFAALTILGVLAQRINILVVAAIMSDAATGWFSASARLVEGLKLGHLALLGALFPVLSRAAGPEAASQMRQSLAQLLGLALILALAGSFFAAPLTALVYGPRFGPAIGALQIQVWSLVPYTFTSLISLWLVARGAEKRVLLGTALGLPLMLGLYLFLIQRLGWLGASWAVVAGESVLAILIVVLALTHSPIRAPLDTAHAL